MTDVVINIPAPGSGIACCERPGHIGRGPGQFDDFTDCWQQRRLEDNWGYIVAPGDTLEFDIKIPLPLTGPVGGGPLDGTTYTDETDLSVARPVGIDLKFIGGPYLSDYNVLDFNGLAVADGDRKDTALNQWYHVAAYLTPFIGLHLRAAMLTSEVDAVDRRTVVYYQRVVITNGGVIVATFWNGGPTPELVTASNFWLTGGSPYSINILDVGIEGDIQVFGFLGADEGLGGQLRMPQRAVIVAGTDTVTLEDSTIIGNASGTITEALPTAVGMANGHRYFFKNMHATGTMVIDPFSTQTIDGASTLTLSTQYSKVTIESYNGNWINVNA